MGRHPRSALGSQDVCGLRPPRRLPRVLAQLSGSAALALMELLPAFIGTSATSQVLLFQSQEGSEEGSVPEYQPSKGASES